MREKLQQELEEILLSEMSRNNTDFVRDIVIKTPDSFGILFDIVIADKEPESRRAIWAMDILIEESPDMLNDDYQRILIDHLDKHSHEALVRHSLRMLARVKTPHDYAGKLINICFDLLIKPNTSIASKAWSMDILYKFSIKEPALTNELISAIEIQQDTASAGIKNKSKKMLKKLYRNL